MPLASLVLAIAADVDIFAFVIAEFAMVRAPLLDSVASPLMAVGVGTLEVLPTNT